MKLVELSVIKALVMILMPCCKLSDFPIQFIYCPAETPTEIYYRIQGIKTADGQVAIEYFDLNFNRRRKE